MTSEACPEATEVTASWLGTVLGHSGRLESFTQASIGTGQVGENIRYELHWNGVDPSLPRSVVGKFPSLDETSRAVGIATDSYRHEVGFYRYGQRLVDVRTPECFYVGATDTNERFVLIMEDIANASQGDQIAGGTVEQAHLAALQAARLHGPLAGSPQLEEFTWTEASSEQKTADRCDLFDMVLPGFVERYVERLDASVIDMCRWLSETNRERAAAAVSEPTLVHGDFRLDNMLFGPDDSVVVVDWQTCTVGSGPADLAYYVGAGLKLGDRLASERDIFDTYYEALSRYGPIERDKLWHDYVLGSASGLFMAVVASQIVGQTERGDEMFAVMAERHAAQIADLDLPGLLGS